SYDLPIPARTREHSSAASTLPSSLQLIFSSHSQHYILHIPDQKRSSLRSNGSDPRPPPTFWSGNAACGVSSHASRRRRNMEPIETLSDSWRPCRALRATDP